MDNITKACIGRTVSRWGDKVGIVSIALQKELAEKLIIALDELPTPTPPAPDAGLVAALKHIRDVFWTDGEPHLERLEYVQNYAREALEKVGPQ